jgi:predicted O-methyltransferase YrrM
MMASMVEACAVSGTLRSEAVVAVLDRLSAAGAEEDRAAKERVAAREAELGRKVYGRERSELYGTAPIAVTRDVGELLHVLAAAARACTIVEFGASLGFSTIHLAAALRDAGGGTVVTTELDERKARLARSNLVEAGLDDLVELRVGDARVTLRDLPAPVDLLFLDGWNDLYVAVLELVEPRLRSGALVVADLSADDPACAAYRAHVDDPARGLASVTLPLDAGVVVSVRLRRRS